MAFLHRLAEVLGDMGTKEKRLRDLTAALSRNSAEMETARNAAKAAGESKGRLIAAVSHELRSPLQSLELYTWLLHNALARGEVTAASTHLDKLVKSCDRMARLVAMMFRHGEIAEGRVALAPSLVNLETLVGDILAAAEDRAHAKGIGLAASFAPGLRPLRTDPDLLRTVISNLVDNAIKFSAKGRVTVAVMPEADGIRCTVTDNGCGIAPGDQQRVFEPFGQVEETGHKHSSGIGLGLPIARSAIELLGGGIGLVSAPGAGSAFSILVPTLVEEAACLPS
jgi:signal transduction histidine kinase